MSATTVEETETPPRKTVPVRHFVRYDAPGRRLARALCGRLVDRDRDHDNEPTCPECAAALDDTSGMTF